MDLQELAERTQIPVRRLRHCLDEGLVPGLKIEVAEKQPGRPRRFHDHVGFAICCAATLIEAGIDRSTVRRFMDGLAKVRFENTDKSVILAFFERQATGRAELGDNINMRIQLEALGEVYDSHWVQPDTQARLAPDYRPLTVIGLDLGQIGAQVFRWQKSR